MDTVRVPSFESAQTPRDAEEDGVRDRDDNENSGVPREFVDLHNLRSTNVSSASLASHSSQMYWDLTDDITAAMDEAEGLGVALRSTQAVNGDADGAHGLLRSSVRRSGSGDSGTSEVTLVAGRTGLKRKCGFDSPTTAKRVAQAELMDDPDNPFVEYPLPSTEEPFVIAHHDFLQYRLKRLPIGVQWEISRLVTHGDIKFSDIQIDDLTRLNGTNREASPRVTKTFKKIMLEKESSEEGQENGSHSQLYEKAFERELAARSPWAELDDEEKYLEISQYGTLGCRLGDDGMPTTQIPSSYYGGKVHFNARLVQNEGKSDSFRVVLEHAELGTSNRFARRFGSSRFLKLSIPTKPPPKRDLDNLLRRPFVLNGCVYRMFLTRDSNVFFVRTDEQYTSAGIIPASLESTSPLSSLSTFMRWHNPMDLNQEQSVAKWVDRFALGLSNSVPGIALAQGNIVHIPDTYCPGYEGTEKPPSEMIMTDGCGFANKAALREIHQRWQADTFPTAVQVRVGGAKGLLLLHPNEPLDDDPNVPRVWIRPSQLKIKHPPDEPLDPANRIIDVLRLSKVRSPCTISPELIINLHANGVRTADFIQLMETGLRELADKLMTWDDPGAMRRLYKNVCAQGGVITARLAREAKGESRIRGLGDPTEEEKEEMEDLELLLDNVTTIERSSAWWKDEISGCPSSLEETVADLLTAGLTPNNSPVCATKLREVFKTGLKRFSERYKITIPGSAMAFIVPDPTETALGPGEIFFSSSQTIIGPDGLETNILVGEVLVGRYPCKLPSDVQKVVAVDREELRKYRDVIIFPVDDHCQSLASKLGGGDYDGDKVITIWQPEIVCNFRNAEVCRQPTDLLDAFEQAKEKLSDFLVRAPLVNMNEHMRELQRYLLNPILLRMETGLYSCMHENSVYMHGYSDPRTTRLAFIFCQCLDGPKAGLLAVKREVLGEDRNKYINYVPAPWRKCGDPLLDKSNRGTMSRDKDLKDFIMDAIKRRIDKEAGIYLKRFDVHLSSKSNQTLFVLDEDLVKPWQLARQRAQMLNEKRSDKSMQDELDEIERHVRFVYERRANWLEEIKAIHRRSRTNVQESPSKRNLKPSSANFTELPITVRQDFLRMFSFEFASGPKNLIYFDDDKVRELRASYAYLYDWEMEKQRRRWSRFPWDVAFSALCEIKAKAIGQHKSITTHFYDVMVMHRSVCDLPRPLE